jgi:hypothetical protein
MTLFREFHRGNLPLYSLNFGTIILFPKCAEAMTKQANLFAKCQLQDLY